MVLYVVERDFPDAHRIPSEQLECMKDTSRMICQTHMYEGFAWITSYIVENKFFCVFESPDEATIRMHSELCKWPITNIFPVTSVIAPKKEIDSHPAVRDMLAEHAKEYEKDSD